jgi:hypothetical protein
MNTKRVKKDSEIVLERVNIAIDRKDGTINRITFTDVKGNIVVVDGTGWGTGFDVLVLAPVAMVKRHQVSGKLKGIAFCETYESEHEALARVTEIGVEADPCELKVVEVPEEA